MKKCLMVLMAVLVVAACGRSNDENQVEETPTPALTVDVTPEPTVPPVEPPEEPEEDIYDDVLDELDTSTVQDEGAAHSEIIGEWLMISTVSLTGMRVLEYGIREEWHFLDGGDGVVIWYTSTSGPHEVQQFIWSIRGVNVLTRTLMDVNVEVVSEYLDESAARGMGHALFHTTSFYFSLEEDILINGIGTFYTMFQRI